MSFRGQQKAKIDEKGRLKIPADFKRLADEKYGEDSKYYITSKDGERAEIYPLKEWEVIEAKIATLGSLSKARKKFLDLTNYYGHMTEMDAQGRLLLPQVLRVKADLKEKDDVLVLGAQTFLEVANLVKFEAKMEPMTDEEEAELAGLGI